MNRAMETALNYAVMVIFIVALFLGVKAYGLPTITDALRGRLENAANAR